LFINEKIITSKTGEKKYWERIKNININENYDLEDEMQRVWDKHKNGIEERIKFDDDLKKAYEFYISHTKEN
jgi:hypothetical protein